MFVTDSQRNGTDGKTPGIFTGFSTRVTETAPEGVSAQPRNQEGFPLRASQATIPVCRAIPPTSTPTTSTTTVQ